jgi:hypothetical protein
MSTGAIVVLFLTLAVVAVIPVWPYSKTWGYAPCGSLGVMLLFLGALAAMGRF